MESCPSTNWCRISQPSVLPMVNPFFIHLHTMGIQLPWGHILTQVIQAALLQFYRKSGEDLHWIQTSRAHPLLNRHVVHDLGQELTNSLEVRFWSSRDNQFGVATRCLFLCWWGYFRRLWTSCLLKMGCYKSWTDLNAGKIGWIAHLQLQVGAGPLGWIFVAIICSVDAVDGRHDFTVRVASFDFWMMFFILMAFHCSSHGSLKFHNEVVRLGAGELRLLWRASWLGRNDLPQNGQPATAFDEYPPKCITHLYT